MSDPKHVALTFFKEVINQKQIAKIDDLVLPTVKDHNLAPGQEPGTAGLKKLINELFLAFPNLEMNVDFIFSEGDKVVCRIIMKGVFEGTFLGKKGTGQPFAIDGLEVFRVQKGKIVERWANFDDLALLKQIGLYPRG